MHFHDILFKIDNFTGTITVPVFDLGISFQKSQVRKKSWKSGNFYSKLLRNTDYYVSFFKENVRYPLWTL